MNITPQVPNLSIPTVVNPPTENLRRENTQREVIVAPEAASRATAEKGVASDKERGRSPTQNNAQIDFVSLQKNAEKENTSISDQSSSDEQASQQQKENEQSAKNAEQKSTQSTTQDPVQESKTNPLASIADERAIQALESRDKEVRAHEFAHAAVGGASTGAPSYSFAKGPDGKQYAVSGEVSVDLSTVSGNPRATIAKMQKVYAAALAPANPSAQDQKVAASAANLIQQAQSELYANQSDLTTEKQKSSVYVKTSNVFKQPDEQEGVTSSNSNSNEFDVLINQTLASQEKIAPSQSKDVIARAGRVENFYANITDAYEKPPRFQFELTA